MLPKINAILSDLFVYGVVACSSEIDHSWGLVFLGLFIFVFGDCVGLPEEVFDAF